ncbi:MAG: serine hydrolase [Rhodospirillales bacterium]|nr:serine hydrolase [Rhodospirillales bacterium]
MTDIGAWPSWNTEAQAGWSAGALAAARAYAATIHTSAAMLVAGGRVVDAWGEPERRWNVHSIRKSLLGALIGIHEAEGRFDLETTIGALGIDDRQGLTPREKLATLLDLLTARSGIYHPSGYETDWMVAIKPARGSAGPGTVWSYNNWDFNALGTAFRKLCAPDIHADFAARIAQPCGMQDFRPQTDGTLVELPDSVHPAYPFRMSARDLARFGELFLRGGRFGGRQIVPSGWVAQSVLPYSEAGTRGAYGYLWWVSRAGALFPNVIVPPGTYAAYGAGGHYVVVLPALDAVFVHRVDTDTPGQHVSPAQFGRLLHLVLEAAPNGTHG